MRRTMIAQPYLEVMKEVLPFYCSGGDNLKLSLDKPLLPKGMIQSVECFGASLALLM